MCEESHAGCCEHSEKLKGTPEDCTPEQIRECHGDTDAHCCSSTTKHGQEEEKILIQTPEKLNNLEGR